MEVSGIPNFMVPTLTISAFMMARVIGIVRVTAVPLPFFVSISAKPPIAASFSFTTSMPTPRPDTSLTTSFVLNPGVNMKFTSSFSSSSALLSRSPFSIAFSFTL